MQKYITPREAYIDFLAGNITECPINSQGGLLDRFNGNFQIEQSNALLETLPTDSDKGVEAKEDFDPNYHEDYVDLDQVDEYGTDIEDSESDYIKRDLWDKEAFACEETYEE